MERISPFSRTCVYLGNRVNERFRLFFEEVVGTSVLAPIIISAGIGGPKDTKSKDERNYQALRQPISGLLKIGTALALIIPIGRKIVHTAVIGKLPEYMNSALKMNLSKIEGDFNKLLERLNHKEEISLTVKQKLKEVFDIAQITKKHAEKLRSSELSKNGKTVASSGKFHKIMTSLTAGKSPERRDGSLGKVTELIKTKYQEDIRKFVYKLNQNKFLAGYLPESPERLKAEIELFNFNSSEIIRELMIGKELTKSQKNKLDELIIKEHTKAFEAGKQVLEWFISLMLTPVSAFLLNIAYPPFVNKIAPNLADRIQKGDKL